MNHLKLWMLLLASGLFLGSNCNNTEILGPVTLELSSTSPSNAVTIRQPFLGRQSVDVAVIPQDSQATSTVEVTMRAEQTESPVDVRCENFSEPSDDQLSLESFPSASPTPQEPLPGISPNEQLYTLQLQPQNSGSGFSGWIVMEGLQGVVEIVASPANTDMQLYDQNDNLLPALSTDAATCAAAENQNIRREFRLEPGKYPVHIRQPSTAEIRLYVIEACTSRETVPRVCPGTSSPPVTHIFTRDDTDSRYRRFFSSELGVGNAITTQITCTTPTGCNHRIELTPYIEHLECRNDSACSPRRSCSSDGYCLRGPAGCSAVNSMKTGGFTGLVLFVLLLLMRLVQRRKRSPAMSRFVAIPLVIALCINGNPVEAIANDTGPNWSAFTEITIGGTGLTSPAIDSMNGGFIFGVAQGIRYKKLLFSLGFRASYLLINQKPPPYAGSLKIYDVIPTIGTIIPAGPLSVTAEIFYALRQFRNNGWVRITGDDPLQHGVGIASTIRYPATRTLYFALRPHYSLTPTTDEIIHEVGGSVVIGFSATID